MKLQSIISILLISAVPVFSQTYVSKQKAIEDLDYYNKNLEEIHVNPFQFVEKPTYYAEVDKIKNNLADSVELKRFISKLSRLSAMMQDAHSSPAYQQPGLATEAKKNRFFPYKTVLENKKLYVAKDTSLTSGIPAGAEILAINGQEVSELIGKFRKKLGGTDGHKNEMVNRLFFHYLFMEDIQSPFSIEYLDPSGKKQNTVLEEGITHLHGLLRAFPAFAEGNSYKIIDDKVGYIRFNSMFGSVNEWMDLLDKAFTEFQEKNIEVVAVDIRDNAGGDSTFGNVLFGFITSKEFEMLGYREWKVSQQYKNYLMENGNDGHEYLQQEVGSVWRNGSCEPAVSLVTPEERFAGKVYLLTGPWTFSSGMMVADAAKQFKLAEVIGAPTGETTTDFGEVFSIALPNSGVIMNLTTSMDIGADCNPQNFSPVMPDVPVDRSLQEKIDGRDKALEYVLNKAQENR